MDPKILDSLSSAAAMHGLEIGDYVDEGTFSETYKGLQDGTLPCVVQFSKHCFEQPESFAVEKEFATLEEFVPLIGRHPRIATLLRFKKLQIETPDQPGPLRTHLMKVWQRGEKSLKTRLAECHPNGIPRDELLRYMEEAAEGIDFLNLSYSIFHRDIKPDNLMLFEGHVQIIDLAFIREADPGTQTATTVGTRPYAPPEWKSGKMRLTTFDIYSLAATYIHLATGQCPFPYESEKLTMEFPDDGMNANEIAVLKGALDPNPDRRTFKSAREFVDRLRNAALSESSNAKGDQPVDDSCMGDDEASVSTYDRVKESRVETERRESQTTSRGVGASRKTLTIFLPIIGLFLAVDFFMPMCEQIDGRLQWAVCGAGWGILCTQMLLLSIWLALAAKPILVRIRCVAIASGVVGVVVATGYFTVSRLRGVPVIEPMVVVGISAFFGTFVNSIPFFLMRRRGWELTADSRQDSPAQPSPDIARLVVPVVAILLIVLFAEAVIGSELNDVEGGCLIQVSLLSAVPIAWTMLLKQPHPRFLFLGFSILVSVLLPLLQVKLKDNPFGEEKLFFAAINIVVVLAVAGTLELGRLMGYRVKNTRVDTKTETVSPRRLSVLQRVAIYGFLVAAILGCIVMFVSFYNNAVPDGLADVVESRIEENGYLQVLDEQYDEYREMTKKEFIQWMMRTAEKTARGETKEVSTDLGPFYIEKRESGHVIYGR